MEKIKIELIVEKSADSLWGRVNYNDNLIVEHSDTLNDLENKLKTLLHDFEDVRIEDIEFDIQYDIYALFEQFDFLNISKIARHADVNPGLLRQYASGLKHPSLAQAKKIEETLHRLATQMQKVSVFAN